MPPPEDEPPPEKKARVQRVGQCSLGAIFQEDEEDLERRSDATPSTVKLSLAAAYARDDAEFERSWQLRHAIAHAVAHR